MANNIIAIEKRLLTSKAYLSLRKPSSFKVLTIFWTKRQMERVRYGKRKEWIIKNNGEITFSYNEAENKYGISRSAFRDAIDELRETGFIDITESGGGLHKSQNLYSISDRWINYGTPEFKHPEERSKCSIRGFKEGNQHAKNRKIKIETNVTVQHCISV